MCFEVVCISIRKLIDRRPEKHGRSGRKNTGSLPMYVCLAKGCKKHCTMYGHPRNTEGSDGCCGAIMAVRKVLTYPVTANVNSQTLRQVT